jgi:hypothetical protein
MTAQLMPEMLAHPPPLEIDLVDADRVVGWIIGDTIGFRGFADETEATHAAWVAHRTLARRLARTHGTRLVPIDIEPLALERSNAGDPDVILASNRPIAALVRPSHDSRAADSFAFEIAVPSPLTELELRGVAYLMYRTLRKSGVRWAIWRPDPPTHTAPMVDADSVVASQAPESVKRPRRPAWTRTRRVLRQLGKRLRLMPDAVRGLPRWSPTVYK